MFKEFFSILLVKWFPFCVLMLIFPVFLCSAKFVSIQWHYYTIYNCKCGVLVWRISSENQSRCQKKEDVRARKSRKGKSKLPRAAHVTVCKSQEIKWSTSYCVILCVSHDLCDFRWRDGNALTAFPSLKRRLANVFTESRIHSFCSLISVIKKHSDEKNWWCCIDDCVRVCTYCSSCISHPGFL